MFNAESTNNMNHSNGEQNGNLTQNIPGGKQHQLPDEPPLPQAATTSKMGCASGREGQQNTEQYFQPQDSKKTHAQQNKNSQSPKRSNANDDENDASKRSKSRASDKDVGSDDERKKPNKPRQSGPTTRSSGYLRKINDHFSDSEDEEKKSYSRYSSWAKTDIADYRNNYPHVRDNPKVNDNYQFYTNQISSYPDGDHIDNIHKKWFGQYKKLEFHHGYIQWLFPLQEKGLNWSAEPLQKHEIELIKQDKQALQRVLKSYKLMLDFYGFELVDEKTGELQHSKKGDYQDRLDNLNTSSHNYLRITRILKCLGEFDYEYLKFGFLETILRECIIENTLSNCLRSCKDYWIETLRSQEERRAIRQYGNDLIKYRNDEIPLPRGFRAQRPTSNTERTAISIKKRIGSNE